MTESTMNEKGTTAPATLASTSESGTIPTRDAFMAQLARLCEAHFADGDGVLCGLDADTEWRATMALYDAAAAAPTPQAPTVTDEDVGAAINLFAASDSSGTWVSATKMRNALRAVLEQFAAKGSPTPAPLTTGRAPGDPA